MSRTEGISLQELPSSGTFDERGTETIGSGGHDGAGEDDETSAVHDPRQTEASRKRAFILLGASISQLPIWGEPLLFIIHTCILISELRHTRTHTHIYIFTKQH